MKWLVVSICDFRVVPEACHMNCISSDMFSEFNAAFFIFVGMASFFYDTLMATEFESKIVRTCSQEYGTQGFFIQKPQAESGVAGSSTVPEQDGTIMIT